ncbi:hypothetical protein QTI51_00520 [Variovorax sp. J22G73]|uniref:hypothetical protein n=1 Tax=unclassified Variovorax TaxID=663243 RepID=UPI002574B1A2|nr:MULTISPECIES: hypothetical protein [unclassified Variovorax]MDM0004596.1 hypothetical protein [Variovorax sp. J22R203]MDM0095738.1 hypothetical protein [Variovorax sp. J22G73]
MHIPFTGARSVPTLLLACALSACGGGSGGDFFGGTPAAPAAPAAPATPPDTGAAPVKSCAP